jgi:hypothetical protein
MENIKYIIENHSGETQSLDKRDLKESIDDILSDIASIVKTYRYNNKRHKMILFSIEHDFSADDYITHYRNLPEKYGKQILSEFDESIIRKLSY